MPRLSGKERVILELLIGQGQKYGAEMIRESNGELKPGTIYVTLDRMEQRGLIESELEEKDPTIPGRPRRLYRITGLGSTTLTAVQTAMSMMASTVSS